ncbi:hypothetical protein [Caloramator proteoclasticus]|uniref:Uncharacterized protein n=1 Tax=Caloramator proteoclasticus DSM 10124 TaxID=1121262 RepID=A0A1M4WMP8_9CLOT|nr:hypothetical protein [Caloramator proteoclasticus]SHE82333.1 hypothetical protein SAMN02746091_01193 [Caloramator proteoclasticus DSM 10124]
MKKTKKLFALILALTFFVFPLTEISVQAKTALPKATIVSSVKSTYLVYEPITVTVNSNYAGNVQYRAYLKNLRTGKIYDVFTTSRDKYSSAVNGRTNFTFKTRATVEGRYQIVVMAKRSGVKKSYESIAYSKVFTVKDVKAAITNVSLKINGNKIINGSVSGNTFSFNLSGLRDKDSITRLVLTANKDAKVSILGVEISLTAYQPKEISLSMLGIKDNGVEGATLATLRSIKQDSNGYISRNIQLLADGKNYTYVIKAKIK